MGEGNTVVSVCAMYRHLQQYCSHPSIYLVREIENQSKNLSTFKKLKRQKRLPRKSPIR